MDRRRQGWRKWFRGRGGEASRLKNPQLFSSLRASFQRGGNFLDNPIRMLQDLLVAKTNNGTPHHTEHNNRLKGILLSNL